LLPAWRAAEAAVGAAPSRLVLTGELAPGLAEALAARLGVEVRPARLGLPESASPDGRQWAEAGFVAYGTLLQAVRRAPRVVEFHRSHSPWARELANLRRHAVGYGVAVALVLGLAGADLYAGYAAQERTYERLRQELTARFHQVVPEATRVVNPTAQLSARLSELEQEVSFFESLTRPDGQPLHWLNLLSQLLPRDLDIEVKSFTLDGKDIRIQGTVKDFEAVERLKGILAAAPDFASVDVRDAKLSVDRQRVRFLLVLTPKGPGGAEAGEGTA
ncbi:MAG: hypothetical protein D6739_08725, partial [Nitrospirae bacterium]